MKKEANVVLYGISFLYYLILISILVLRSHARPDGDLISSTSSNFIGIERKLAENARKLAKNAAVCSQVLQQDGTKENDRITELPGQPGKVNFEQYGGYVTVNKTAGRAFYYYFVEADNPNKDLAPLLLWLNGGPGCSSLGHGAMQEIGPFRVKSDGKTLYENVYAWNKVANVLFLESPAGVGFSYSNTTSDTETNGDKRTAADGYVFLLNWLQRFPEYKNRDFYITGESYAGHYVPQLADTILQHNKIATKNIVNLKGIAIGNPTLDDELDEAGKYNYLWMHAMISDNEKKNINDNCDFSLPYQNRSFECSHAIHDALTKLNYINQYNIYASECQSDGITDNPTKEISITNFDLCTEEYVNHYLNLQEVQLALHANITKLYYPWKHCSARTGKRLGNWRDSDTTIIPLLQNLITNRIRILVYSGDFDTVKAFTGTKEVLKKLNLTEQLPWAPWNVSGEVGGYGVVYKGGLTFSTVRGAGHAVPSFQPERAFTMIKSFLKGEVLPEFWEDYSF